MRRKREYYRIYLSPGVVFVFVSVFIGTISGGEIKENSGVKYDSGNKGVIVSEGESSEVNLNSKDAENLNFNMDTDYVVNSALQIWDFKDTVTFDVIQNKKVKVIFEPTSEHGYIGAELQAFGCHSNKNCPSLSHEYFHRGEQTYVLYTVHSSDQDHSILLYVTGLFVLLTFLLVIVLLYRRWKRQEQKSCEHTDSLEERTEEKAAKVSKHQISNSKHSSHQISKESAELKNDCLPESSNLPPNCKDYQVHVKMRKSKEEKNHFIAASLAVSTGLFCLLMVSAVVWFGRAGVVRKSSDDPAVLKIMVPSKTHVRHIRSYSDSPEISDVDLGQDKSLSLLTRLQFLDLSSDCRHNLTLCRTHALCDATNPDAGLQCRCNRGFYLKDLTCVPCQTSCKAGFYMTQQCGASNDVVCKPCTVCSGTTYAAAQCTSTQDTICIDVTFPVRQFINKLQKSDEQLLLNYTVSDNVFLEQLYKIRQLQQPLYMKNNKAHMDLVFERPSGLEVKIRVEDIYLIPEYVDINHVDDIQYVMNNRGFPMDDKNQVAKVVKDYCSHPIPDEYDLHLSITRNIATAAAEITCDSKNSKLPACPSGYKDGDQYVYQFLDQPCRKVNESRNPFHERRNNILCSDNPDILNKVFHVAVQNSEALTFPSELCKNYAEDCQRCLSTSTCSGSHCCDDIDCYARTSCRNLYTSVCPGAPVRCTRGDVSKLSIVPHYNSIDKEFSCHLQHHSPKHLYIVRYEVIVPKLGYTFRQRSKEVHYYNISHQEDGTDLMDYLIVSHQTNIPLRDEVMLIGTFGNERDQSGALKVDYSLHRLKKSNEFDRSMSFNIRRTSSTSLRTKIQFESPFLYSTSTWRTDGCDKNVTKIVPPQTQYHTQGQPLEQMVRKKLPRTERSGREKEGKFLYELLTVGTSPHVKFTVPENISVLSYYKDELSGSRLNNQSLQGSMVWDRQTMYWNITISGSISSCPGYYTVEIYKGAPLIRLAVYDMMITCPKYFTLRFFITHHESVDIPDIFTAVLNDSVTSHRLVLSSVQGPQIFHTEKSDLAVTKELQGSPWAPIIAILIVCSIACVFLLILYAYCDSKQTKGIPPDIKMPKPDLGAQITLLQNMDIEKPPEKLSFQSKIVMATLVVLYIVYALSFTFLVLFGLLHLMQGPHIGDLAVGSNTSAKIHSKVESHLQAMVNYESNETTRLTNSTQRRLMACSNHLKTSLYDLIPQNSVAMRKSLRKVFEKNGTVHFILREYFTSRLKEYQPKIKAFIDEFDEMLDRNLHQLHVTYTTYLKNIAENRWLEFPKQVFLEQERQEGRQFSEIDDENRADFLTWLEVDKVQEMIAIKDILMSRMLAMMPKVNFSELLADLDSELDSGDRIFTHHENWIKFSSSNMDTSRIEAMQKKRKNYNIKGNETKGVNSKSGSVSSIKSIIYPLFVGVFFILDGFLLIYRFSWMVKCVKNFKKGIEQRVPFDSITRKIHFVLTGKDVPKVGENLEFPYDCAMEALKRKEDIWGDNTDKYFIYCQASAKSREDILREIFKEKEQEKPTIEQEKTPYQCCCIHCFVKGGQLLYRMFISPIFWRFALICGFVLLLCLVTKATNDIVTMESAMFLLDTDAVWPVLARQEVVTNQVIFQQGLYLNSFLEKYKDFVDTEIQILNSILIAGTEKQSHLLNAMISDLCNISSDGLCAQSLAVELVVPTLTSCNFLPLKPQMYSGFHRTIMLEYIKAELFPLVNNLRSILFSAFYLLLTFVSAMLICQICARVIFVYLQKSRLLRTTKIYQLSGFYDQEQQDFQMKDMYEGQSLVAESCESGVYDMTS